MAVVALRSAIAAIDNAEAVDVCEASRHDESSEHIAGASAGVGSAEAERRVLSDADVRAVVRAQADERSQAAQEYEELGRDKIAERLRREAQLLRGYLPEPDRDG
ncbi:MAG: GatB/YqeY domain-containing protein [Solirubrobacteraceae bacterium]